MGDKYYCDRFASLESLYIPLTVDAAPPTTGLCYSPIFSQGEWIPAHGEATVKIVLPPFRNGVYPKRKEYAPKGNKFLSFKVDHFQMWLDVLYCKQKVTKVVSLHENGENSTVYRFP